MLLCHVVNFGGLFCNLLNKLFVSCATLKAPFFLATLSVGLSDGMAVGLEKNPLLEVARVVDELVMVRKAHLDRSCIANCMRRYFRIAS